MSRGYCLTGVRFGYQRGRPVLVCEELRIEPGLTLLLGPNGAGKSTLMKLLAGVERPHEGTVTLDGLDLWVDEVGSRQGLAYVPEQPDLTPYASVREVIRLVAALRSVPLAEAGAALETVGLADVAGRSVRELSMGQRRRAVLAAAFVGHPATLLLDEPLETLDRSMREVLLGWLGGRISEGATVVVSTHEIEPFLDQAAGIVTVVSGTVRWIALPADPAARRRMAEAASRPASSRGPT
ncbi:MAG: ATP-binding cassette domain-containing protein [Rhodanobacter sp.]